MFISLFLLALVAASVSSQDGNAEGYYSCFSIVEEAPARPGYFPDAEQIMVLCPTVKKFLDCLIKEELYSMLKNEVDGESAYLKEVKSQRALADDMCDEDSELYKAYVASVDCYRSLVDKIPICLSVGKDLYNDFREFIPPLEVNGTFETDENLKENIESYIQNYQPSCVEESYQMACIAIEILETCGSQAYDVFSEIIRRAGDMKILCSNEKNHKLRAAFLEFLETEKKHERIDIISQVFDLRKK